MFTQVHSSETPNVLRADKYKPFWLSWRGGKLKLGHGDLLDKDAIITWSMEHNVIGSPTVMTLSKDTTSDWLVFQGKTGDYCDCSTKHSEETCKSLPGECQTGTTGIK